MSDINKVGQIKYDHNHSVQQEAKATKSYPNILENISKTNKAYSEYSGSLKDRKIEVLTKPPFNTEINIKNLQELPRNRTS